MNYFYLSIITLFNMCLCKSSDRHWSTEQQLYQRLMMHYEVDVRPTTSYYETTNVTFGVLLNQIVDVDEKNQVLTTRVWLNANWMDKRLSWNKTLYDGIEILSVPYYRVWRPDVMLTNNADPNIKEAVMSTDVAIKYDGNITWLFAAIYRSPCLIDVRYYPFDDQVCHLNFACWSHTSREIDLRLVTEEGDLSNYLNNSEFHLLNMRVIRVVNQFPCCRKESKWPTIQVQIMLRRRPLFYVFNHILPCVLISSMALFGFYMPPDTGEKVTTCITTMLSMGVYLKTITEIIPPTAEAVPLIGVYYVVSLMVVCAATVMNVFTLNIYRKGTSSQQDYAPRWMRKLLLKRLARLESDSTRSSMHRRGVSPRHELSNGGASFQSLLLPRDLQPAIFPHQSHIPRTPTVSIQQLAEVHKIDAGLAAVVEELTRTMKQINATLMQHAQRTQKTDLRERISLEWKQIALVMDRSLLLIFFIATTITTYIFLVEPVLSSEII